MITCFEGLDAAGKSTHSVALAERLGAKLWKFPDRRTPTGKLIYEHLEEKWWLVAQGESSADPGEDPAREALVFQALQMANRMEVAADIFTAAARGHVVFDRYWPSAVAYGKADGLDAEYLENMHAWLPQPDLFLLLDIDPGVLSTRRPERRDRYEASEGLLAAVAGNYRELWLRRRRADPLRWVVVDARGSREETADQIHKAVASLRASSLSE